MKSEKDLNCVLPVGYLSQMKLIYLRLLPAITCLQAVSSFPSAFTLSIGHEPALLNPLRLSAEKETLKFVANIKTTSEPLESVTIHDLSEFLTTTTCRNLFLSAGGTAKCDEVGLTPELEQIWRDLCETYELDHLPAEGDAVVSSDSVLQFPGLKMVNHVYTGVKLNLCKSLPFYEFLLIGERRQVFGLPPVVWIFNQLTGNSADNEEIVKQPSGKVLSILTISDTGENPCFSFDCSAEIKVEFPKFLVKILPASKEKMEEQGTASVKKAIENDIYKAVNSVNDAFFDWLKLRSESNIIKS